jgi:hypothetical protein
MVTAHHPAPVTRTGPKSGVVAAAAGMTLLVGLTVLPGIFHLWGVIVTATRPDNYSYDFRFAALLLVGILLVAAGTLCGLSRGWTRPR